MRITFKLYANLTDYLPPAAQATNRLPLDVPAGTTVADVIARQNLPEKSVHLVLVNGVYVPPEQRGGRVLAEGEELAIWPPIAGG
jgi:sulfur carrier protein ThiS